MAGNLSKAEEQFKKVMGAMGVLFLIAGAVYAWVPEHVVMLINFAGGFLGMPKAPVVLEITDALGVAKPAERGFVGLAAAYMVIVTVIALACYFNPRKYMDLVPVVLLGKLASSAFGLIFYFWSAPYFSNLVLAITDLPIFVIILVFYLRARWSPGDAAGEAG